LDNKLDEGLFSPNGSEHLLDNADEENLIKPNVSLHTSLNSLSQLTINGPNSINSSGSVSSPNSLSHNLNNQNGLSLALSNGASASLSNGPPSSGLLQPSSGQPSQPIQPPLPHAPCSGYPMMTSHGHGMPMMGAQSSMGSAVGVTSLMSVSPTAPMLSCNAQLPSHANENNSPMSAASDELCDLNASNDMLSVASPSSNPGTVALLTNHKTNQKRSRLTEPLVIASQANEEDLVPRSKPNNWRL
jgi:hypothetical protein